MQQPLSLEILTVGSDCALIRVAGEIDVYSAPQLREAILGLIGTGVSHVIADLRAVDFLDSTGLGAIVGGHKRLRTNVNSWDVNQNQTYEMGMQAEMQLDVYGPQAGDMLRQ